MGQFKIHVIEPLGTATVPCILTAVYKNPGGYTKLEWFLLVPDDEDTFYGEILDFNNQMDNHEEDFLLQSALMRATWKVRQYMNEANLIPPGTSMFQRPAINEDHVNLLMHYRINKICRGQLDKVIENTGYDPLRDAIQRTLDYQPLRIRAL